MKKLKPEDVRLYYGYNAYGKTQKDALNKAKEMGCIDLLEIQSINRVNGLWCVEFTKEIIPF